MTMGEEPRACVPSSNTPGHTPNMPPRIHVEPFSAGETPLVQTVGLLRDSQWTNSIYRLAAAIQGLCIPTRACPAFVFFQHESIACTSLMTVA